MKRLMLATIAGATLLAGATAANAQYYYDDGYYHGPRGPFVERGVGLHIGPVGVGVYDNSNRYYDGGWNRTYGESRPAARDNSTYNSRAFRSQEIWPQSPPGGS